MRAYLGCGVEVVGAGLLWVTSDYCMALVRSLVFSFDLRPVVVFMRRSLDFQEARLKR